MTREEFMWGLRATDDVFDDEPLSRYAQQIADYDADRRELVKDQRALIEQQAKEIERLKDLNEHLKIEVQGQAKEIDRLKGALDDFTGTFETDFLLDGVIVDNPNDRWGQLTRLYTHAKQALKDEHS